MTQAIWRCWASRQQMALQGTIGQGWDERCDKCGRRELQLNATRVPTPIAYTLHTVHTGVGCVTRPPSGGKRWWSAWWRLHATAP